MVETSCTITTNSLQAGLQTRIQKTLIASQYRSTPTPLNTVQIADKARAGYLPTLYHLKQLELEGKVRRVDYYPNLCVLLLGLLPNAFKSHWLKLHATLVYDPTTGWFQRRSPRDYALWIVNDHT